jgi:peroxiredoxin
MATPATAPPFRAPSSRGQTLDLESFAGKVPIVLVPVGRLDTAQAGDLVRELDDHEVDFGRCRVQVLGLAEATAHQVREYAEDRHVELTLLADPDGAIRHDYGLDERHNRAVVVDRSLRVTTLRGGPESPAGLGQWLLEAVRDSGVADEPEPIGPQGEHDGR